jgi:hypothetical protein
MIGDDFVDLIFNFEVALFFTLKLSYDYAYSVIMLFRNRSISNFLAELLYLKLPNKFDDWKTTLYLALHMEQCVQQLPNVLYVHANNTLQIKQ